MPPILLPDPADGGVGVVALCVVGGAARHERREAGRARKARAEVRRPEVSRQTHALQFEEFNLLMIRIRSFFSF